MAMSLRIKGEDQEDFFNILCVDCEIPTSNEYLGGVLNVKRFQARCEKCGGSGTWSFYAGSWKGLPTKSEVEE